MSKLSPSGDLTDPIRAALGTIPVPGSLDDFASALTKPSRNVIRLRRDVSIDMLPLETEPVEWYSLGRRPVATSPKPSRFLSYAAGDYFVQDAGSLLALSAAGGDNDSLQGKLICDLCAAPGGKSTALVEAIGDSGFLLANEVIGSRIGPLQLNLARAGSDRYGISNLDPETLADHLGGRFDLVLVDAPCSGQAMLGRRKQKTSSLSAKQIGHSAIRQARILDAAIRLVRDGGRLVYSTCTFAEAENEAQVSRLIASELARPDPIDALTRYQTLDGCYRLWPHRQDCAGGFAASLRINRSDVADDCRLTARNQFRIPDILSDWYRDYLDTVRIHQTDSIIYGWPVDVPEWIEQIAVAGPELAHLVGQTWKPSHAGALRRLWRSMPRHSFEIDAIRAKQFMRGEAIACDGSDWLVVRLGGRPLGWIKASGGIGKNHLPKPARMQGDLIA